MPKQYTRVSRIHTPKPDRTGNRDVRMTVAPIRLPQNVSGQNRKGTPGGNRFDK